MAWNLLFWLLMFVMNLAFIVSSFYQVHFMYASISKTGSRLFDILLCLVDLEGDHLNPFEASSHINFWVLKEFLLHGVFCVLLLVTGHWFMFLVAVPLAGYHVFLYVKREHLIDVTEVFRTLKVEKRFRFVKLGFYVVFFIMVVFNLTLSAFEALSGEDDDLHIF